MEPSRSAAEQRFVFDDDTDDTDERPEHALLPGGEWAIWRWVTLRSAGFSIEVMRTLSATACATAADELAQAEDELAQIVKTLQRELLAALYDVSASQAERGAASSSSLQQQHKRKRQIVLLLKRRLPLTDLPVDAADVAAYDRACAHTAEARQRYQASFAAALLEITRNAYALAKEERFREALLWQNRRALHEGIDVLLRQPPEQALTRSKQRQHLELIASYAQRYCTKNDTIGFFGPVGWARVDDQAATLTVEPGAELYTNRSVHFEGWCIDRLAHTLSQRRELWPWMTPRQMPTLPVAGLEPAIERLDLSAAQLAVLRLCNGRRTARQIAAELTRQPTHNLPDEAAVFRVLEQLRDQRLILWEFELPLELHPQRTLRQLLQRIDDERLRQPALADIDALEAGRQAVARAAGNVAQLDPALAALEQTFSSLTGAAPTRASGQMYAARTLVYEDCRRDLELEIGPELLEEIGTPLSLLLTSARWFTHAAARRCLDACQTLYAEIVQQTGSPVVELVNFWPAFGTLFSGDATFVDAVTDEFTERWEAILKLPEDQLDIAYSSDELRARVLEAFDAPAPGWQLARYHSPDVMIAAESVEAIQRGDYQLVLGEMHLAVNTMAASVFVAQHPSQEDLFSALEEDMPDGGVVPIVSKRTPRMSARMRPALAAPQDMRIVLTAESGPPPQSRSLPIGALVLEDEGQGITVRTRDRKQRFNLLDTFVIMLSLHVVNGFRMLRPRRHSPRISIDRLIVSRESWTIPLQELAFTEITDEAERFLALRRWVRQHAIPQHAFVKLPSEVKPVYMDFASPLYVGLLVKLLRRAAADNATSVTIVEMLPNFEQVWLPDAEGRRYTSEFRFVAVDQRR